MIPTERVGRHALAVYSHRADPDDGGRARVVLVHGTMDRATSLAKVARRLRDIDVVRYDRRGYGESGADVLPRSIDDHVTDLFDVLDGRPAAVIGHSMGGTIAVAAAARRPDLIPAVGAYEAPRPWTEQGLGPRPDHPELDPGAVAERFMRRMVGDTAWARMPGSTRNRRRSEGGALIADMQSIRERPAYDDSSITVPVIAAHGSESDERHIATATELARLTKLGTLIVVDGAAHGAHLTHPDSFAALVRTVIASIGAPGRPAGA